ncbi:MAG: DUF4962 domain-containing protein, partial [Chthoniobacterales bacterium]
ISQQDVNSILSDDLPTWEKHLSAGRPHLFYTPRQWADLPDVYRKSKGKQKELFDETIRCANALLEKPAPSYQKPNEKVTEKVPLDNAKAELWLREIGDGLLTLCLAYKLTGDEAIKDRMRDYTLTSCTYPGWGKEREGIYLASSHMIRGISVAYDWFPQIWTNEEKKVILERINLEVGGIYNDLVEGKRFWTDAYDGNHNHVNIGAIGLAGLAFFNDLPDAKDWAAASVLNFRIVADVNNADGSTPEGTSYWDYSMSAILEYIEATKNIFQTDALYESAFLKNAISYRIHSGTPIPTGMLPWGAVGGKPTSGVLDVLAAVYSDSRAAYVSQLYPANVKAFHSSFLTALAAIACSYRPEIASHIPEILDHHMQSTDVVTSRSGWTENDYLLSAKSGVNVRNHGHLDAGSLALAFGNEWLLTAPRYGAGKRDGTGDYWRMKEGKRWKYFSTSTEGHSTLLVNHQNQRSDEAAGASIENFESDQDGCTFGIDLCMAYPDVESAYREVYHKRGKYILVFDNVDLKAPGTIECLTQVLPKFAIAHNNSIDVAGKYGSLNIRLLYPQNRKFKEREPDSEHYALSPERLKTFAIDVEGKTARFVTLLLPYTKGEKPAVENETLSSDGSRIVVTLKGADWTDRVTWDFKKRQLVTIRK